MSSPIYLEFLSGKRELTCTAWGNPTRNVKGWKGPCYLITDEHHDTFDDLMEQHRLGQVRLRQGPALRALHGPLRLRAVRRLGRQQAHGRQPQNADVATVLMSADIAISDPCVVFALSRESMFFRGANPYQQTFPGAPCRAQFRGPASQTVLMLETGLGAVAMQTALRWCLHAPRFGTVPYRPRFVISAGFSGALQPEQHVGDVILATEVVDGGKNCWPVTLLPDTQINDAQRRGRLLTWPDLVGDPQEKKRLGRHYQALAVDMETAVLARLCHEHGVPFTCVRVISDDLNTPLSPHLIALLQRGRVSAPRLALSLLRQPTLLGELWHLAGQTRTAAKQLALVCQQIGRG